MIIFVPANADKVGVFDPSTRVPLYAPTSAIPQVAIYGYGPCTGPTREMTLGRTGAPRP